LPEIIVHCFPLTVNPQTLSIETGAEAIGGADGRTGVLRGRTSRSPHVLLENAVGASPVRLQHGVHVIANARAVLI